MTIPNCACGAEADVREHYHRGSETTYSVICRRQSCGWQLDGKWSSPEAIAAWSAVMANARPRGIEELEAADHSWMTRDDALGHYLCAQANWNIVLDQRDQLLADLLATRRALKMAQAKALRKMSGMMQMGSISFRHRDGSWWSRADRLRGQSLINHYAAKFEREAEETR